MGATGGGSYAATTKITGLAIKLTGFEQAGVKRASSGLAHPIIRTDLSPGKQTVIGVT
jgi:hypothetical protein